MGSALLIAAVVGSVIAVQVGIIGRAVDRFDALAVSLMLQVAGVMLGLVWVAVRSSWAELVEIGHTWWWVPLGIAGWMIVAALGFASSRAGVTAVLAVSVSSQLAVGLSLDLGEGRPIGFGGAIGVVLLIAGIVLVAQRG